MLFKSGATKDDILTVIELKVAEHESALQDRVPEFLANDQDTVYTELPPGLIDLPSAAKKYGMNRGTLRNWLELGHIKKYGRLKGAATGGGFILLAEQEVMDRINAPRQSGRPRTKIKRVGQQR